MSDKKAENPAERYNKLKSSLIYLPITKLLSIAINNRNPIDRLVAEQEIEDLRKTPAKPSKVNTNEE